MNWKEKARQDELKWAKIVLPKYTLVYRVMSMVVLDFSPQGTDV